MNPPQRIIPLTDKQIKQRAAISVLLVGACLVSLAYGIVWLANPNVLMPLLILSFGSGLIGLPLMISVFARQLPQSRTRLAGLACNFARSPTVVLQILQEGIRFAFAADGGAEPVAGKDRCFVREGKELLVDGAEQLLVRPAPQV